MVLSLPHSTSASVTNTLVRGNTGLCSQEYTHTSTKGRDIKSLCPRLDADESVLSLLDEVVKSFGKFYASALSEWTHIKGSPWDKVVNEMEAPNSIIPDALIADYFRQHVFVGQDGTPNSN